MSDLTAITPPDDLTAVAFKDEDSRDGDFSPIGPIFWVTKKEMTPISNLWYTKGEAHRLANHLEVQLIEA